MLSLDAYQEIVQFLLPDTLKKIFEV